MLHPKFLNEDHLEHWKMNLLAVSEKHRLVVIAIGSKLNFFKLDLFTCKVNSLVKDMDLLNDNNTINNLKLVRCAQRDFVVTVDDGAFVRMVYLDDLDKDPIKFLNNHPGA
jgi:hypothetical protein